jgi:DNA-binding NarL/FixJ family response regulator
MVAEKLIQCTLMDDTHFIEKTMKKGSESRLSTLNKKLQASKVLSIPSKNTGSVSQETETSASTPKKSRVLVVDDHAIVREGIAQLINHETDLVVCGEADNAHKALEAIPIVKPDIAIVDISLTTMNGIELIKNLRVQYPKLPILVLSMHDESLYAERALRAGARGYIMKQEGTANVRIAIRQVLKGEIYVSEKISAKMLSQLAGGNAEGGSPFDRMSDRELEVFQLIGQGFGTRQIAEKLHLSVKTIESYREHIKEKMNFKSGTELVQQAVQWVERRDSF